jgi:hypothetical protein
MKKSTVSTLRAALATAIQRLESHLETLNQILREEEGYPLWVWHEKDQSTARLQVRRIITAIDYQDGQDPTSTRICPALVGGSATALAQIHQVNAAKVDLQQVLKSMDGLKVESWDSETETTIMRPLVKVALAALGHARLHRRQATRKLVILDHPPESVSFIWSRLPKIENISVEEARHRLETRLEKTHANTPFVEEDLRRLQQLDPHERLAIVNPPHIHPRANIAWLSEEGRTQRAQKRAVLPLFYLATRYSRLPRLRPLPEAPPPPGGRLRRSDATVETSPFLVTIRAHRYQFNGAV